MRFKMTCIIPRLIVGRSMQYDMLCLMLFFSPCRLIHKNVSPEGSEKPKSTTTIKHYALSRYMQLVKSYEKVLEKKFPTALHVYRIFMVGIKDFYRDMKFYFKIYRRLSMPAGFKCLTRKEIELYHQMPKDMMRVAPMLILSTLPFANYIVLPLVWVIMPKVKHAYWCSFLWTFHLNLSKNVCSWTGRYLFPRQLLCQHFWTLQQRTEFAMERLRIRLYNYRPVFRCVQAQLDTLKGREEHEHWAYVLGLLGSGMHPKPEDIVKSIDLFRGDPYHLSYLYPGHVVNTLHIAYMYRLHIKIA